MEVSHDIKKFFEKHTIDWNMKTIRDLRNIILNKIMHRIPENIFQIDVAEFPDDPCVNGLVSADYRARCIQTTIHTREEWLRQKQLPDNTQMNDHQRRQFLNHVRDAYENEDNQQHLQTRDLPEGGRAEWRARKRSRWSREMQRRCGTKALWELITFTTWFDPECLYNPPATPAQPGAAHEDEQEHITGMHRQVPQPHPQLRFPVRHGRSHAAETATAVATAAALRHHALPDDTIIEVISFYM